MDDTARQQQIEALEREMAELDRKWAAESARQTPCVFAILTSIALFAGNFTGATGPKNNTLGAIAGMLLIGGVVYLLQVRKNLSQLTAEGVRLRAALHRLRT